MSSDWSLTIGNFDGVHLGHRELLAQTVAAAKKLHGQSVVFTFHPHPAVVLAPERAPLRLFDLEDQQEQFRALGIDRIQVIEFTKTFAETTAEDFFRQYILATPGARVLWVGHDFQFGKLRMGNHDLLKNLCSAAGLEFHDLSPIQWGGRPVSSSAIREFLKKGELKAAEELLGRRYSLRGRVVAGDRRGRGIGFPTANLELRPEMKGELPLRRGVYAGLVQWQSKVFSAVLNVGVNPTVSPVQHGMGSLKVEVHLFDFEQEIYGETLKVELIDFLREEKKFSNLEDLKTQIAKDAEQAKKILQMQGS